jgi:MoxR-like ATPase
MNDTNHDARLALGRKLTEDVLMPLKTAFVGKDEIIDLLGVSLVARENLFILGPPGTAKSALVQQLAARIEGRVFDYLLTRFTEPNEIFGPFDIRKLRDGDLVTNTEGMLPEATFVFLDELLNANSAILNSLLMVLNERIFRRGRETKSLPTLMVVGASNRLPEDDALGALFDRFLLRVQCDNVSPEEMPHVLQAGWKLDTEQREAGSSIGLEDVHQVQSLIQHADFSSVHNEYVELIHRMRHAGVMISDRRAVKLQRILAASAILCGRLEVNQTDMWVLRHIWDTEEQQDILASIVRDALSKASEEEKAVSHARSRGTEAPDPEHLAQDLSRLGSELADEDLPAGERSCLQDQLGLLAARCQWVEDEQQRKFLEQKVDGLWDQLGGRRE